MKRVSTLSLLAGLLLAAAGCVSIRENRLEDGSLSVEIEDSGWYVFGFLPIVSGDSDSWWPNWFSDDVSPHTTIRVLDRILAREKAEAIGPVVTREEDENILIVITRVSYHTSAVIPPVRVGGAQEEGR